MTALLEEELHPQREGLPPGYRMRAEAHYVDQLVARAPVPQVRAVPIGDIDCPRPVDTATLEPLVRSIAAHGVLQRLLGLGRAGRVGVISGARLAAGTRSGLTYVSCVVHTCDEARARAIQDAADLAAAVKNRGWPCPIPPHRSARTGAQPGFDRSCLQLLGGRDTALRRHRSAGRSRECHTADAVSRCVDRGAASRARRRTARTADRRGRPHFWCRVPTFRRVDRTGRQRHARARRRPTLLRYWPGRCARRNAGARARQPHADAGPARVFSWHERARRCRDHTAGDHARRGALARLVDVRWTDRPGGYQAAVGLAAARRIVDLHEGPLEAKPGGRGGCQLLIELRSSTW